MDLSNQICYVFGSVMRQQRVVSVSHRDSRDARPRFKSHIRMVWFKHIYVGLWRNDVKPGMPVDKVHTRAVLELQCIYHQRQNDYDYGCRAIYSLSIVWSRHGGVGPFVKRANEVDVSVMAKEGKLPPPATLLAQQIAQRAAGAASNGVVQHARRF